MSFLKSPLVLRIARVASVLTGLTALGGIVFLAHRDANPPPLPSSAPANPAEKVVNDASANQPDDDAEADLPAMAESSSVVLPSATEVRPLPAALLDPRVFSVQPIVAPADRYLPSSKSAVVKPGLLLPVEVPELLSITPPADTYLPSSKSGVVRPIKPAPPAPKSP